MATSYSRGWSIYYDWSAENWRYCNNDEIINNERLCKKCGRTPTKDGYDACIGHIEGATAACCGHGILEPCIVYETENNVSVKE